MNMSSLLQEYSPDWAQAFTDLRGVLKSALGNLAIEIHHVGSTSIPGMLAKPVLDIAVEIPEGVSIEEVSGRLREIGYEYEGIKGITDRHAFKRTADSVPFVAIRRTWMNHHLYVLPASARELRRYFHFRDSLVASPELRAQYRELKERCASAALGDRKVDQAAKDESPFFARVLAMPTISELTNRANHMLQDLEGRLASGQIDEAEWYRAVASVITPAYLAGNNPRAQSGHSGDDTGWTWARSLIADAIHCNGTFLDVGCANGYLMECIQVWARDRGFAIEPYGLDIAPELVELARQRLPHLANRIDLGNAFYWKPDMCFDFVRTGLEYVPVRRQRDFIAHLLREVVRPGGRLIIGAYNEPRASIAGPDLEQTVTSWGFAICGRTSRAHRDSRLAYKAFWIDSLKSRLFRCLRNARCAPRTRSERHPAQGVIQQLNVKEADRVMAG